MSEWQERAEHWQRLAIELACKLAAGEQREAQFRRALRGIIEMCHAALEQKD